MRRWATLTWLGAQVVEVPYIELAQGAGVFYYLGFVRVWVGL